MAELRRWPRAWVFALFFVGCGPTQKEDFDNFCLIVNEVNKDANLGTDEKLSRIIGRAPEYTKAPESQAPGNVWLRLNETPPEKKYAFISEAAKMYGRADWRCNGYEKLLVTFAVEQEAKQKTVEPADAKADAGVAPDDGGGAAADDKATKKKKKGKRGRKKKRGR